MHAADNTLGSRPVRVALRATYRLQFHRGFTLRQALPWIPYLHELGISHVYASPLLKACPGSTHGYDVCDPSRINPEVGTDADLAEFVAALRQRGMGLVIDLVPNHMGIAGGHNPWWWDVLACGRGSRYAAHFDIQWDSSDPRLHGKVLVPVLGDRYDRVLASGQLQVECHGDSFRLRYHDHRFPIAPGTVDLGGLSPAVKVARLNEDHEALDMVLRQQHYHLTFWRHGDAQLNYRRFFSISTLAGVRVEDESVFQETHVAVLRWYDQDKVDGLRIDHPDGLRDPKAYLDRLRQAAPKAWIVVEKILEPGEALPPDWPVAGTTGYDFLNQAGGVLVDPAGKEPLARLYEAWAGPTPAFSMVALEKKRHVLRHLLVAEVRRLSDLLWTIAARLWLYRDFTAEAWRDALIEFVACFPVYRTYVQVEPGILTETDRTTIHQAARRAQQERPDLDPALFRLLTELLQLRYSGDQEHDFVMRLQQLTGPAMAKGLEDTAFYTYNRFVALNEVGGDPSRFGVTVDAFHAACSHTQAHWPQTMLASATHDTKRSEDVRARLYLLSEIPGPWEDAVRRWSQLNAPFRRGPYPDRNAEYLFYQTLVGAWPLSLDRALAYMEKASCEAKEHTDWTQRNQEYDSALREFITRTLAHPPFLADLEAFVSPLIQPGQINSLAQTLLKLTAPGVPDIYQGTELWDLSLVDPDNRRPVDVDARQQLMSQLPQWDGPAAWRHRDNGLPKLWLIQKTLACRARHPDWFGRSSSYQPLFAQGPKAHHLLGFLRGNNLITLVPRLVLGLQEQWGETTVDLPPGPWENICTGQSFPGGPCRLDSLFAPFPVALLTRPPSGR